MGTVEHSASRRVCDYNNLSKMQQQILL